MWDSISQISDRKSLIPLLSSETNDDEDTNLQLLWVVQLKCIKNKEEAYNNKNIADTGIFATSSLVKQTYPKQLLC